MAPPRLETQYGGVTQLILVAKQTILSDRPARVVHGRCEIDAVRQVVVAMRLIAPIQQWKGGEVGDWGIGSGAKRSDERRIGIEDPDARPPHGLAPNVDVGRVTLAHRLRTVSRRVEGAKIQNLVIGALGAAAGVFSPASIATPSAMISAPPRPSIRLRAAIRLVMASSPRGPQ